MIVSRAHACPSAWQQLASTRSPFVAYHAVNSATQMRLALHRCLTTAARTLPEEAVTPSSAAQLWSYMSSNVHEQPSVRALLPLLLAHTEADGAPPADTLSLASATLQHLPHSSTMLWGVCHADTAKVLRTAAAAMQRCAQDELQSGVPPSTSAEYLPSLAAWLNDVKGAALCAGLAATLADGRSGSRQRSAPAGSSPAVGRDAARGEQGSRQVDGGARGRFGRPAR